MNRKMQLEFCKKCVNRQMDLKQGLLCKLTQKPADFEDTCSNFNRDEEVPEVIVNEEEVLTQEDLTAELDAASIEKLKFHQDFYYALLGGLVAMFVSAVLWAVITVATEFQIGFMAIGVGLLVGFSIQYFGAGIDQKFGYLGAVLSFFGCILGNLFSQLGFISDNEGLGYIEILSYLDFSILAQIMAESFHPMDLLFYGIAIYEGYKFAFRKITVGLLRKLTLPEYDGEPANQKLRMPLAVGGIVVFSIFIFYASRGVSGNKTYYYESGNVMSNGELKNSKEHGEWTFYYENGEVYSIGNFEKGQQTGRWEWYDLEGTLVREGSYNNGLEDGVWINYYANGQMSDSGLYLTSRLHGFWKYWYEDGSVYQTGFYDRNKPDSIWTLYYENGNLSSIGAKKEGVYFGTWLTYYSDGQLATEIDYRNGEDENIINVFNEQGVQTVTQGNGMIKSYYEDGVLRESGKVKEGKRAGVWTTYKQNGEPQIEYSYDGELVTIKNSWSIDGKPVVTNGEGYFTSHYPGEEIVYEEGQLHNGLKEGVWKTYYYDSGNILTECEYEKGKENGLYTSYYESGQVSSTGLMSEGKFEGEWLWYYESGVLSSNATFIAGIKTGEQLLYNESGYVSKTEIYDNGVLIEEF